jgi:hypothetical protein
MIKYQKMGRQFWQLVVISLILSTSISASAEWNIYKKAEQRNKEGNLIRFDIGPQKTIRVWLILKRKTVGAFKSKLPLYQVDNNDIHDLQLTQQKTIKEDKWIGWIISDKTGNFSPDLLELMNGKEVTFQYYLPDGMIKETTFSLEGIREAIEEILK